MIRMIRLPTNRHRYAYRLTTIAIMICEDIILSIRLLQDARFYIMNKDLTLSHTPIA